MAFVFGWRVVPGTVSTADGGLVVDFDPLPAGPPFEGVTYRLKRIAFDLGADRVVKKRKVRRVNGKRKVRVTKKRVHLITNPRRCEGGSWTTSMGLAVPRRLRHAAHEPDGLRVSAVSQPAAAGRAGPELADDLVFDVGFHHGEDTVYYLRKGYRVVGFEAHPALIEAARVKFAAELEDGRLQLVAGAITAGPEKTLTFYTHSRMSSWGTTETHRADRNAIMGESIPVTVPAVDFAACLREHGVPHYVKIDIEAADMLCLEALEVVAPDQRPRYTSIEAESETWAGVVRQFDTLERLGYTRFAIVQQANVGGRVRRITTRDGQVIPYRYEMESSGPFGDDLTGPWTDRREALRRYRRILPKLVAAHKFDQLPKGTELRYIVSAIVDRPLPGWFDIHAAR